MPSGSVVVSVFFFLLFTPLQSFSQIYYTNDFEQDMVRPFTSFSIPFLNFRGKVDMTSRDEGELTYNNSKHSLRLRGTAIWNRYTLKLHKPLPLNQPVVLTCAIRSEGASGEIKIGLKLAGESELVFSQSGSIGRKAAGRWERLVARLDHFSKDLQGKQLVGLIFLQRCALGEELPGHSAAPHELLIDDIRIATPPDDEPTKSIALDEAGVKEYQGPAKFTLNNSQTFTVWHSPSIVPVLRNTTPPQNKQTTIPISAARGEGESFQIVVTPTQPSPASLTLELSPLQSSGGERIQLKNIEWHPVRYVHINSRLGESIELDWPDPLSWDRITQTTTTENAVFWITINVPVSAQPGKYHGSIKVVASGLIPETINIPLELKVLPFQLPVRPTFKTNQQLWGIKSGEMRPWLTELAARKMFDANMWYSDVAEQKWRMEELGQNSIKINMVGGHGPKPVTLDGHSIYSSYYKTIFTNRLKKNLSWLHSHKWSKYSFIYIWDENWGDFSVFDMANYLTGLVKKVTTDTPIMAALPFHQKIDGKVDIYLSDYNSNADEIKQRITHGDIFWRWGNAELALGQAPLATRFSYGLEAIKLGYTGAYSWGVNVWKNRDPWIDNDKNNWSGSFFYPGQHLGSLPDRPVPSIRMELLRDGIEDFEYISLLKRFYDRAAPREKDQIQRIIKTAIKFCNLPSDRRRCNQDVDEFMLIRKQIQHILSTLSKKSLMSPRDFRKLPD